MRKLARMSPRVPAWLWVPAACGAIALILPLVVMLARTPWSRCFELLASQAVREAITLSLVTASIATLAATIVGVPLAWCLGKRTFPGQGVLRLAVTIPLVLPPVVGGAALLFTYGRNAPVGEMMLDVFGISIPFTTVAVVMAQTFVAMPFLVISLEGAFRTAGDQLEEVAATLGASQWRIFRRITMPTILPALLGGLALCWARAIGEFGATLTFAGSIRGRTQTLPVAINELLGHDIDAAMMASALMVIVAAAVLIALRGRWLNSGR